MARANRNGSANGHDAKILKRDRKGQQPPKVSSCGLKAISIFRSLVGEEVPEERAWHEAWKLALHSIPQDANCGTVAKPENDAAKWPISDDPFHVVVSRGISRFIQRHGLSCTGAEKKYGLPQRCIYRLVNESTPGLVGGNIDKVCRVFGITPQELIDLGTPRP